MYGVLVVAVAFGGCRMMCALVNCTTPSDPLFPYTCPTCAVDFATYRQECNDLMSKYVTRIVGTSCSLVPFHRRSIMRTRRPSWPLVNGKTRRRLCSLSLSDFIPTLIGSVLLKVPSFTHRHASSRTFPTTAPLSGLNGSAGKRPTSLLRFRATTMNPFRAQGFSKTLPKISAAYEGD